MVCVYCGEKTDVTNSRPQKRNNQVWRRRECQGCGAIFTTHEAIDLSSALLVQPKGRGGSPGPFLPDLLFTELLLALQHRKDCYTAAREITSAVTARLLHLPNKPVFNTVEISRETAKVLGRFDKRAWMRYQADHPSLQG